MHLDVVRDTISHFILQTQQHSILLAKSIDTLEHAESSILSYRPQVLKGSFLLPFGKKPSFS